MGIAIGPGRGEEGKIGVGIRPCTAVSVRGNVSRSPSIPPPHTPPNQRQKHLLAAAVYRV